MLTVAEFAPDQPPVGGTTDYVNNVVPITASSYGPLPDLVSVGNALGLRCQGAGSFRGIAGTVANVAGDGTKLYSWNGQTWSDISRTVGGAYATQPEDGWDFEQFGDNIVAVNGIDAPQVYQIGSGLPFSALTGSPPISRFVATVRDFLVMGRIQTALNEVRWSGINNVGQWTVGTNQSDLQDLPTGGRVMGLVGGEYGVVFQENAIRRMTYVGSPLIFQFDVISNERGIPAEGSIASYQQMIFYLTNDGFFSLQGGQVETPIGDQKVDRYFWDNVNQAYLYRIISACDPIRKLYFCAFPSLNSALGTPDTLLIYNWTIGRWAQATINLDYLYRAFTNIGYTMDSLDALYPNLDAMTISLDSALLTGDTRAQLSAFSTSKQLSFFTGSNLAASIDTVEDEPTPGNVAFVRAVRPVCDGGNLSVQMIARNRLNDVPSSGIIVPQNAIGLAPQRSKGRYQRARCTTSYGDTWTHFQGVDPTATLMGWR